MIRDGTLGWVSYTVGIEEDDSIIEAFGSVFDIESGIWLRFEVGDIIVVRIRARIGLSRVAARPRSNLFSLLDFLFDRSTTWI